MKEQLEKEKLVLEYFMNHPNSFIRDIAEETGVPKSSVQRYLQKYSIIRLSTGLTIEEQLKKNQNLGRQKGGIHYFQNNAPIRDENGKFTGSEYSPSDVDKVEAKKRDILFLATYYIDHYPITCDEMSKQLEELGYTKDYIYHCLTSASLGEIIGESLAEEVDERLTSARYSFDKKVGSRHIDEEISLTPREEVIASLRKQNTSQKQVGRILGVSRGTIQKWESRMIQKITDEKTK